MGEQHIIKYVDSLRNKTVFNFPSLHLISKEEKLKHEGKENNE